MTMSAWALGTWVCVETSCNKTRANVELVLLILLLPALPFVSQLRRRAAVANVNKRPEDVVAVTDPPSGCDWITFTLVKKTRTRVMNELCRASKCAYFND